MVTKTTSHHNGHSGDSAHGTQLTIDDVTPVATDLLRRSSWKSAQRLRRASRSKACSTRSGSLPTARAAGLIRSSNAEHVLNPSQAP